MKIFLVDDIISKLENCIKYKKPFSHIRFGDGGLKFIDAILTGDIEQLNIINLKEGLPPDKIISIYELWGYYARHADFIDSSAVYFNDTFWPRVKKPGKDINANTKVKMLNWERLYNAAEFDNKNYCNPESNYLLILNRPGHKNIFDIMKNKKIALITAIPEVKSVLGDYNIDVIPIVKHYENQYKNSFHKVMKFIKSEAKNYDFFINASGELGRIYSGTIKEFGGRVLDMGFVIEYWFKQYLHPRLKYYMTPNPNNKLELMLTTEGKKHEKWI